jgi:ABC-type sugar transport system substrate-binding protein
MKKLSVTLFALLMVFVLAACGSAPTPDTPNNAASNGDVSTPEQAQSETPESEPEPVAEDDKVKIVVMPKLVGIDYYNAVEKGVNQAAQELGDKVEVTWLGPTEATVDKQIEMLETIILDKPDVICVAPNDGDAIVPFFERCAQEGIKVITFDADAMYRDLFVNLVDYKVFGESMLDSLAEQINNEGEIAIITTSFTSANQMNWYNAIEAKLKSNYPNITLVDYRAGGESAEGGYQIAQDLMKTYPNLKGFIVMSTPAGTATLDAIDAAGKTGQIKVTTEVTPNAVRDYIKAGKIRDVSLWDAPGHGYLTVYSAYNLFNGDLEVGKSFDAGYLGSFTPQADDLSMSVALPLLIFNKDNIDDYDF